MRTVPGRRNAAHSEYVTAVVPIIDLDVPPPRADAEPRSPRLRPVLVLGVVLLSLVVLGFAAAPARRLTQVLAAGGQPAAAFVLGPGTLYTAHYGNNPNSESAVRRWNLSDGALSWAAPLPQNVENLKIDAGAHVLMASSGSAPKVAFVDTESGARLWELDTAGTAGVVGMAAGAVLIQSDLSATLSMLRLVDDRTGREIWSRVLGAIASLGPDDMYAAAPARIVAVAVSGDVTVLRWTDGALLGAGNLRVPLPVRANYDSTVSDFFGVSPVGDRIYVSRRDRGRTSMTAFSVLPVMRLWTAAGGPAGYVSDCGDVLCVADTRSVAGVDPATGAVRWSAPEIGSARRLDATRLLGYDQQENPNAAVLDARTGRVVRRLGQTYQVGDLLVRLDAVVPGRSWVSVVDPADATPHTVGSLGVGAPYGCAARDTYLACPTVNGPTLVWHLPTP
jgi:outer membrane protein assembly factor BamB